MVRLYFLIAIFFPIFICKPFAQTAGTITLRIDFNEWMDTTGFSNPGNFRWSGGLETISVELADTSAAIIRITEPEINKLYTLKVYNVYDRAGNLIDPEHDTTSFIISALPVELKSFTANVKNEQVFLKWITETEVNNYGFEIERAAENNNWVKINFVEGHGNSNSPKEYSCIDKDPVGGNKFKYRLKQIDNDGKYEYSDVIEVNVIPRNFVLYQNYPNPFNPVTTIRYSVPVDGDISLIIYNIKGEKVRELVGTKQKTGKYEVHFDAAGLASGIYFYRLIAKNFSQTKKMVLLH